MAGWKLLGKTGLNEGEEMEGTGGSEAGILDGGYVMAWAG